MDMRCPGARFIRQPEPELFRCRSCGWEVEIWTDELKRACPKCGNEVTRLTEMSCIEWCKMAGECVGEPQFEQYMANRVRTWKSKLLERVDEHFRKDSRRKEHARNVLLIAEELMAEGGGDPHIVVPAAILHDIGIKEGEEGHDRRGAELSKKILLREGFQMEHVEEICEIIAHHHSYDYTDTMNFKIVYDADRIVNLEDHTDRFELQEIEETIGHTFLTSTGKRLARERFLT